jgi:calpain
MQKNRRVGRKAGLAMLNIGFSVYALPEPEKLPKPLQVDFFKFTQSADRSTFTNLREVSKRLRLPPGTYAIVPSTFNPNNEGDFLMRVFSETKNEMTENDEDAEICEAEPEEEEDCKLTPEEEAKMVAEMQQYFEKFAGDDMEIDAEELKEILDFALKKEFAFEGFSLDVCRSMVAMTDDDRSGKLGLPEFQQLWRSVRLWKNIFKKKDNDNSGTLSSFELRSALNKAGYYVNWKIMKILILRYGRKDGTLYFDDFIMCLVKLKTMLDMFKERAAKGSNKATFEMNEYLEKTLYC